MIETSIPPTTPVQVARDTFLIPNLAPAGDAFIPVNSVLIRGEEPIVVDTGAPVHREHWLDQVFGLVEPRRHRWVFLSHEDGDDTGALDEVLEVPKRHAGHELLQHRTTGARTTGRPQRMIWREPGDSFETGDRRLRLLLPPIFDGPATAVSSTRGRACCGRLTPLRRHPARYTASRICRGSSTTRPSCCLTASSRHGTSSSTRSSTTGMSMPWKRWRRGRRRRRGPVLVGDAFHDAFDRVRTLAGQPRIMGPGQELLDEILSATAA